MGAIIAGNLVCGALTSAKQVPVSFSRPAATGTSGSIGDVTIDLVPQSFFEALEDFKNGRVVDLDVSLTDPPPNT